MGRLLNSNIGVHKKEVNNPLWLSAVDRQIVVSVGGYDVRFNIIAPFNLAPSTVH